MPEQPRFATTVIYVDDVPATLDFYGRALDLVPSYYDEAVGFALFGAEQSLSIASHGAGTLMMEDGYRRAEGAQVAGVELAFFTEDVAGAFARAVEAGAAPLASPRQMPWGQTVAYARAPEGTILGFVTPPPAAAQP